MAYFSVETLQKIAVDVTSNFYNHGTPLSVGLAKQAADLNLNSDQLRRSIEATNTLAYLKSVEGSDRTGEFALADYDEILKCASLPEDMTMTGRAPTAATGEDLTKQASAEDPLKFEMPELTKQATLKHLQKEASINRRALEDAQARAFHLTLDLEKAAHELAKTPFAVEGMSLATQGPAFVKLARLTFGTENTPTRIDWVEDVKLNREWKPAMQKAAALSAMLTQAQETVEEINYRSGLDKQAGVITSLATSVGQAARGIVTAPFKFVGNKVANGASAAIDSVATKAQTGFASTGLGKKMGIQPGTLKPSTVATMASSKKFVAGATLAAGAGLDAVSFRPHVDPSKNQGGDVWAGLN